MYKRASQSHANDNDRRITSAEKGPNLWSWQHCCVCRMVKWRKKVQELPFHPGILCSSLRCALADRLLSLLLKPGYLVSFIDIFSTEGEVTELIPFVISLHTTTVHSSTPCHSLSLLIVAKVAWWAGEAAQWDRTERGSLIDLFHWCCCHAPPRWSNCFMYSFHLCLVSKYLSLPVRASC